MRVVGVHSCVGSLLRQADTCPIKCCVRVAQVMQSNAFQTGSSRDLSRDVEQPGQYGRDRVGPSACASAARHAAALARRRSSPTRSRRWRGAISAFTAAWIGASCSFKASSKSFLASALSRARFPGSLNFRITAILRFGLSAMLRHFVFTCSQAIRLMPMRAFRETRRSASGT
jgi:hypothetical protein